MKSLTHASTIGIVMILAIVSYAALRRGLQSASANQSPLQTATSSPSPCPTPNSNTCPVQGMFQIEPNHSKNLVQTDQSGTNYRIYVTEGEVGVYRERIDRLDATIERCGSADVKTVGNKTMILKSGDITASGFYEIIK
jgi:hypothetical protein